MAGAAVWLGAYLTGQKFSQPLIYAASLSAGLVCAAGNIFNDIVDRETDKINHPTRPIVSRIITIPKASIAAIILSLCSVIIGLSSGEILTVSVIISLSLLAAYSLKIKRLPLIGNLLIACLGAFPIVLGAMMVGIYRLFEIPGPIVAATFALLVHLIRELVKDLEDKKGDLAALYKTLPFYLGERTLNLIISALMFALSLLIIESVLEGWYGRYFALVAVILAASPLIILSVAINFWQSVDKYRVINRALKIIMLAGMLAFLVGKPDF